MNKIKKSFIITMILIFSTCAIFAQSINEKVNEPEVRFSDLDLKTESVSSIMDIYASEVSYYEDMYQSLYDEMLRAYEKDNAEAFYNAIRALYNLSYPTLTKEQTETLISRIVSLEEETLKTEFSNWLYDNSRYYKPTLSFSSNVKTSYSQASYSYSISVRPESTVKLPNPRVSVSDEGIFVGWGLVPGEANYKAGEEIAMPYTNQSLYAVYQPAVQFYDSITGFDFVVDLETSMIPVLEVPEPSYIFLGWYDSTTGKVLEQLDGTSARYVAKWKSLSITDISAKYYDNLTIDKDTQVQLSFTLTNNGNCPSGALTVELVPENEETLKIVNAKLSSSSIEEDNSRNGSFIIVAKGNSTDTVSAKIVVTDSLNNVWETPVVLTIK